MSLLFGILKLEILLTEKWVEFSLTSFGTLKYDWIKKNKRNVWFSASNKQFGCYWI